MLISFSVKNFRSIKDEQVLDFTAGSSKTKSQNTIRVDDRLNLLKSIVIYGANASGKTNLIRAFFAFRQFVLNSTDLKKGDLIPDKYYDPFLLNKNSQNEPTVFKVEFIGTDSKKYVYETRYNRERVLYENLRVYETAQDSNLFLRENGQESVRLFPKFQEKTVDESVLANHLFLTKIGNSPNEQIGNIYLYFKNIEIWNTANSMNIRVLFSRVQELFSVPGNDRFRRLLSKLINISDTKINSILIGQPIINIEIKDTESLPEGLTPELVKEKLTKDLKYQTFGVHSLYDDGQEAGTVNFEFIKRESTGTLAVFSIGGLLIHSLLKKTPSLIMLDEFDNSIHPELCRFLIELFHNPIVNKNNSQILFATHETQLLDKDIFRKDQIWLAEKNKCGETDFYSVTDFKTEENLREGTPFDKWYKLGKLGGIPHIKKTEFFAEYEP